MKLGEARFIGSFTAHSQAPDHNIPEIAIGGRSNVGKSSLINSLLNRKKLALVSKSPGKTRMLNYFAVENDKRKELFFLVDLPGYGYARVSSAERRTWKKLVEGFIESSRSLRGFILLVDCRRGLQDNEVELIEYLLAHGVRALPALTKADKMRKQEANVVLGETSHRLQSLGGGIHYPILHSSSKKIGNDVIWRWIMERISDVD